MCGFLVRGHYPGSELHIYFKYLLQLHILFSYCICLKSCYVTYIVILLSYRHVGYINIMHHDSYVNVAVNIVCCRTCMISCMCFLIHEPLKATSLNDSRCQRASCRPRPAVLMSCFFDRSTETDSIICTQAQTRLATTIPMVRRGNA